MKGGIKFLLENSLFLIFGAIGGLVWANVNPESYAHLLHFEILENHIFYDHALNAAHPDKHVLTLHYLVNDILMALFFGIAGKEVWEATLPGGPLNDPKKAATPLFATVGGMAGPALLYVACAAFIGNYLIKKTRFYKQKYNLRLLVALRGLFGKLFDKKDKIL